MFDGQGFVNTESETYESLNQIFIFCDNMFRENLQSGIDPNENVNLTLYCFISMLLHSCISWTSTTRSPSSFSLSGNKLLTCKQKEVLVSSAECLWGKVQHGQLSVFSTHMPPECVGQAGTQRPPPSATGLPQFSSANVSRRHYVDTRVCDVEPVKSLAVMRNPVQSGRLNGRFGTFKGCPGWYLVLG